MATALSVRLLLLFTSQSACDGDEAVIGVMAKHIFEGNESPLFFYGQTYGGGAFIEAQLASIIFYYTGISSLGLKFSAIIIYLMIIL